MNFDLASLGYLGVGAVIFCETGMLFGLLLPGDSLLFAAGMFAAQGYFNIWIMTGMCVTAAFIGNLSGYWMGRRFGQPMVEKYMRKSGTRFITPEKIEKTKGFLTRHHNTGIIAARFITGARTFAPVLAGILNAPFLPFLIYSLLGAVIWGGGLPLLGYYLGYMLPPSFLHYLILPVAAVILLAVLWPYLAGKFKKQT